MAAHDPSTPIQTVFTFSKTVGAYPTTRKTMVYALFNLTVCIVVVSTIIAHDVQSAASKPPNDIVSVILEHLENVEVSLLFFMTLAAITAYAKYDMVLIIRSLYQIHDSIFKLGIVPVYRTKHGIFLLAILIANIATEYAVTVKEKLAADQNIGPYVVVAYVICGYCELIVHTYTVQFFCIMEMLQDQIRALTSGLVHDNQWYLESVINVESHVLQTAKYAYALYVKMISITIVRSTIAMMTHAYQVTKENDDYVAMMRIVFEFIVILYIVDACGQLEFKVGDFNARLFKLMRLSKGLCQNNKLYVFMTSKQTLTFTACGFFTINHSLIVSIVAAVTTYLVILVQLSKPAEPIKFD